MTIDTSAVVAVFKNEALAQVFEQLIADSECAISTVSYLEASIALLRRVGEGSLLSLDLWLESAKIEIVPFTTSQARLARGAFARYGKGRHPAGLNFGDCAAYALAMERGDALLFQGTDFSQTDVLPAVSPQTSGK